MKGSFRRIFAAVLLPVLLAASNGIVVLMHTCLSSDSVEVTLFQRSGCCSDQPCSPQHDGHHDEAPAFEEQCCILKADFVKVHLCQPSVSHEFDFNTCSRDFLATTGLLFPAHDLSVRPYFPDDASPPERASSPDFIFSVHQLLI